MTSWPTHCSPEYRAELNSKASRALLFHLTGPECHLEAPDHWAALSLKARSAIQDDLARMLLGECLMPEEGARILLERIGGSTNLASYCASLRPIGWAAGEPSRLLLRQHLAVVFPDDVDAIMEDPACHNPKQPEPGPVWSDLEGCWFMVRYGCLIGIERDGYVHS